ncbi:MvaI/BcnI family restriction endonuclease [Shewanella halifaxensis]|uniref:MvaI/BcnI family restriction endonuclease n=1 Tax=Shewanella halifaxensis TaxID=271098 RepID=UPI0012324B22|nr:MvaI/BcnI family restriction endonuclease [Shewanella halifaxensis]
MNIDERLRFFVIKKALDMFEGKAIIVGLDYELYDYQAKLVIAQASGALTWADLWRRLLNEPLLPLPEDSSIFRVIEKHSSPLGDYRTALIHRKNKVDNNMSDDNINCQEQVSNKRFLPNGNEKELIKKVQKYIRNNYSLVRLTFTMLDKSTIDASKPICKMFYDNDIFNYETAIDGDISYRNVMVFNRDGHDLIKTSFYRPKAKPHKKGDPRFWPWGFKKSIEQDTLIYITTFENTAVIIPLTEPVCTDAHLESVFGSIISHVNLVEELINEIKQFSGRWVKSCNPSKKSPKDVGDTLELLLGLDINNRSDADYKSSIELKAKRSSSKTADTLFSQVPDWNVSPIKSVRDMMLTYGYLSTHKQRQGYKDLFVTVSNIPNPQGLFLEVDYDAEQVVQYHVIGSKKEVTAIWLFEKLQGRLIEKHPNTAWIIADETLIDGEYHFNYNKLELTSNPIFSQFLSLIEQGVVRYDWRGGYEIDGSGRVDKGHAFRLKSPKFRDELFGEIETVSLI